MSTKTTRYEECRGDIAKAILMSLLRLRVKPAMTALFFDFVLFFYFLSCIKVAFISCLLSFQARTNLFIYQ